MGGYQEFRELRVWQEAKELAVQIYKLTTNTNFARNYGLRDQARRAAVSVASNIAEGYERNSNKDFIRYLLISKGSLSELRTQLEIALEIGYIDGKTFEVIEERCQKTTAMLVNLIKARKEKN
ncbi:MAG: four helix bundle protein [Planctomycetota bacterium]|nr:MAG: four helix bundle protein [Planctomycetota bacterium]